MFWVSNPKRGWDMRTKDRPMKRVVHNLHWTNRYFVPIIFVPFSSRFIRKTTIVNDPVWITKKCIDSVKMHINAQTHNKWLNHKINFEFIGKFRVHFYLIFCLQKINMIILQFPMLFCAFLLHLFVGWSRISDNFCQFYYWTFCNSYDFQMFFAKNIKNIALIFSIKK